jgi:flagellin-like protein
MNKKGISPLIATVLIIGFTILAAILVINWINDLVGGQTDLQQCQTDAGNKCTNYYNLITFSELDSNAVNASVTVSNLASEDVTVISTFLDASGNSLYINETLVSAASSVNVFSTTAADAASVRVITKVSSAFKDITCEVACGEGVTVTA